MPQDGAIIFSDLIGKLDVLRVTCDHGHGFRSGDLGDNDRRGHTWRAKISDWLRELTADCPKKAAKNWSDQCAARCPDLAAVL
jgi:hypothetical protein